MSSDDLTPIDSLTDSRKFELERNNLANQILAAQLERDKQRQNQRRWLFWIGLGFCGIFYGLAGFILWKIYDDVTSLQSLPTALVFPLLGLLTVPTIFLIMLMLCIYRQRVNVSPDKLAKALIESFSKSD